MPAVAVVEVENDEGSDVRPTVQLKVVAPKILFNLGNEIYHAPTEVRLRILRALVKALPTASPTLAQSMAALPGWVDGSPGNACYKSIQQFRLVGVSDRTITEIVRGCIIADRLDSLSVDALQSVFEAVFAENRYAQLPEEARQGVIDFMSDLQNWFNEPYAALKKIVAAGLGRPHVHRVVWRWLAEHH